MHGIIIIYKTDAQIDTTVAAKAQNFAPLQQPKPNKFGPQSQNLASIIRGYKIGVTKNARQTHPDFAWQSRYHDHIIRNDEIENVFISPDFS